MDSITKYFDDNWVNIQTLLSASKYPKTAKLFLRFYQKINSISSLICRMNDLNDFYPCMILQRAQIEHMIVVNYVFYKYMEEHSDSTASVYYEEYYLLEQYDRGKSGFNNEIKPSTRVGKILNGVAEAMKDQKYSNLKKIVDEYLMVAKQFKINKISKYVAKTQSLTSASFMKPDTTKSLLENYSILSSFIHAGPTADVTTFDNDTKKIKEALKEGKDWNNRIIEAIRIFIVYFLAHENEGIANDLRNIIDKERELENQPHT
jgi:hypothetical protein